MGIAYIVTRSTKLEARVTNAHKEPWKLGRFFNLLLLLILEKSCEQPIAGLRNAKEMAMAMAMAMERIK